MKGASRIHILSGPVQSGKTSGLKAWCAKQPDVAGILTPDIQGSRMLYDIGKQEYSVFEVGGDYEGEVVETGRFRFAADAFENAKKVLCDALQAEPPWLVVDEFGKLELKGAGLEPLISRLVGLYQEDGKGDLLIVIRDYLLEDALRYLSLEKDEVRMFRI